MKRWALITCGLLAFAGVRLHAQTAATAAESAEQAIEQQLTGYASAVNDRQVAKLAEFFTPDATLIDVDGQVIRGREVIRDQFAEGFAEPSEFKLETTAEATRFLTPDVAQVEGLSKLTAPNESSIVSRFSALMVREGDTWRFAEIRDQPAPPEDVEPYERLRELEWMIGQWTDDSPDATIDSSITWGPNRAFMVRSATSKVADEETSSSLMILAWDPRTEQIRSWLFDSAGGLGEAVWTRSADDQWVIKAAGVLRNGTPTSATQIVNLVSGDVVRISSLDRIIGGEVAPDIVEVVTVRKPPAPNDSARAKPSR